MWSKSSWLLAVIFTVQAHAKSIREGFLLRENGKFYLTRLPDGWSARTEVKFKAGGLPLTAICFRNENPSCKRYEIEFESEDKGSGLILDAKLLKSQ